MQHKLRSSSTISIYSYGLLGLGSSLAAIHLALLERFASVNQFSSSLLLWVSIAGLMQQHWGHLKRGSSWFACWIGGVIVIGLLIKAVTLSSYEPFLRLWPLLTLLSLALFASGGNGLRHFWREAIAWAMLSLPPGPLIHMIDLAPLTAKIASFLLWYLGCHVSHHGTEIALPTGTIAVWSGCSGVESILQLLGLAVLFILFFSPGWLNGGMAIGGAIVLAIGTNASRVALLAILNAHAGKDAFEYWHSGDGSQVFSLLAVTLFGALCLFLMRRRQDVTPTVQL